MQHQSQAQQTGVAGGAPVDYAKVVAAPISPFGMLQLAEDLFGVGDATHFGSPPRHAGIPMDTHVLDSGANGCITFSLYLPGAVLADVSVTVNDHDHQIFVRLSSLRRARPRAQTRFRAHGDLRFACAR